MAKTKSGILYLTNAEREGLRACAEHAQINKKWEEGGSVTKEDKKGNFVYDKKEGASIDRGFEVIKFILDITK